VPEHCRDAPGYTEFNPGGWTQYGWYCEHIRWVKRERDGEEVFVVHSRGVSQFVGGHGPQA
jgi:hypothetical protein